MSDSNKNDGEINKVIENISNSNEFKKIVDNISNNILKLNDTISDDDSENIDNSLDNILGMFFLDKNGNNICDCINRLTNVIENYKNK